jgi:membrane-bound lytic murein transglycosylase D
MTHSLNLKRHLKALAALAVLAALPAFGAAPGDAPSASSDGAALREPPPAFDDIDDVPLPDPDLWQRIRVGFALEPLDSPLVAEQEEWYASRPDYIKRFVDRGSLYLHYIVEQVEKRHMPTEIALLPVVESAFTPRAESRARASGLWQFIPSTGKTYGLKQNWWVDNRNDVVAATTGLRCAGLSATNSSSVMPASLAASFTSIFAGAFTVVKYGWSGTESSSMP